MTYIVSSGALNSTHSLTSQKYASTKKLSLALASSSRDEAYNIQYAAMSGGICNDHFYTILCWVHQRKVFENGME